MFKKDTPVAWVTRNNTFMGKVIESKEDHSIVEKTSSARRTSIKNGTRFVVNNINLADMSNGRGVAVKI